MILEINQTNSAGINMFDVVENGQLLYRAESPWYPMVTDHTRKIKMFNPMGQQVFETHYSLLENIAESAIPYKYLFTGAQRFNQYSVINSLGNTIGAFYKEANGLLDGKMILQNGDRGLTGYRRNMGPIEVVSLYEGESMVAHYGVLCGIF